MLIGGHGQAKVLTRDEILQLLYEGFNYARDRAIFALCLYTACRISEARQMHFSDAFYNAQVRSDIVIRKDNTKGKQGTRTIPTHPDLALLLQKYHQESLQLLELRKVIGDWTHLNLNEDGKIVVHTSLQCPKCNSIRIKRDGIERGQQRYFCKDCHHRPIEKRMKTVPSVENSIQVYDPLGVVCSSNYGFLFENPENPYLFPGHRGQGCLSLDSTLERFEFAFKKTGIIGAGSHSCRRTALTLMHREGILLRVIQEISGHKNLANLQLYLEVSEEEVRSAISFLD